MYKQVRPESVPKQEDIMCNNCRQEQCSTMDCCVSKYVGTSGCDGTRL